MHGVVLNMKSFVNHKQSEFSTLLFLSVSVQHDIYNEVASYENVRYIWVSLYNSIGKS